MSTTENTEEKEQDIVVQGVHNYSAAETYCRPEEPILQEKLVPGSEAGPHDALGSLL